MRRAAVKSGSKSVPWLITLVWIKRVNIHHSNLATSQAPPTSETKEVKALARCFQQLPSVNQSDCSSLSAASRSDSDARNSRSDSGCGWDVVATVTILDHKLVNRKEWGGVFDTALSAGSHLMERPFLIKISGSRFHTP